MSESVFAHHFWRKYWDASRIKSVAAFLGDQPYRAISFGKACSPLPQRSNHFPEGYLLILLELLRCRKLRLNVHASVQDADDLYCIGESLAIKNHMATGI
jgi:hypothetical protein